MCPMTTTTWFKSSYSGNGGNCIEVSPDLPTTVPVRDSKDPHGPTLVFPSSSFAAFVAGIKASEFGMA